MKADEKYPSRSAVPLPCEEVKFLKQHSLNLILSSLARVREGEIGCERLAETERERARWELLEPRGSVYVCESLMGADHLLVLWSLGWTAAKKKTKRQKLFLNLQSQKNWKSLWNELENDTPPPPRFSDEIEASGSVTPGCMHTHSHNPARAGSR